MRSLLDGVGRTARHSTERVMRTTRTTRTTRTMRPLSSSAPDRRITLSYINKEESKQGLRRCNELVICGCRPRKRACYTEQARQSYPDPLKKKPEPFLIERRGKVTLLISLRNVYALASHVRGQERLIGCACGLHQKVSEENDRPGYARPLAGDPAPR